MRKNVYDRDIDLGDVLGWCFKGRIYFTKHIYDNVAFGPQLSGIRDRGRLDEIVEYSLTQFVLWNEVKDRLDHSAMGLTTTVVHCTGISG